MIELSSDQQALKDLGRAVAAEADGKTLKRELAKRLRGIMDPLKSEVVRRLMATGGGGHPGQSMRQAVAKQVRAGVRFSGRNTGVNLVQRARGMPREFPYAGRAMNRDEGWKPRTLGGATAQQYATPAGWFDEPTKDTRADAQRQVKAAMDDMARRLAARAQR